MIYLNFSLLKIQIRKGKPHEFTDSHPGSKQHYYLIIIPTEMLVVSNIFQISFLLFLCHCHSLLTVIRYQVHLEIKWIFPQIIIINSHLKSRF